MYNLEENKIYLENIGLHLRCNAKKVIYLIHEIICFSKKLLFFQIRDFKSKITRNTEKNYRIFWVRGL